MGIRQVVGRAFPILAFAHLSATITVKNLRVHPEKAFSGKAESPECRGGHGRSAARMLTRMSFPPTSTTFRRSSCCRFFTALFSLAIMLFCAAASRAETGEAAPLTLESLREQRAKLATAPRPLLFANDGVDTRKAGVHHPVEYPKDDTQITALVEQYKKTPDNVERLRHEFLMRRTIPLLGTQFSTILYNSVTGGFPIIQHRDSKIGIPELDEIGQPMRDAGLCPLQMTVEFAHANGKEVFYTFRVNSLHDGFASGTHWIEANTFKRDNPELMMDAEGGQRKRFGWTALDYEQGKTRETVLAFLGEILTNYDVDGLDIDFMRFPYLFKNTYRGEPCTPAQRDLLTTFMRDIRELSEREGLRRGRPILVNVRVADSVRYNLDHGIDVEAWLREDLVDTVSLGGIMHLQTYEDALAELRKYGKPLYASIENPVGAAEARGNDRGSQPVSIRRTPEATRARAMEAWGAGADGIYFLNYWFMRDNAMPARQIGSAETLVGTDKDYFACWGLGEPFGLPHGPYRKIETLSPAAPRELEPGKPVAVTFPMFDDFGAAEAKGKTVSVTLRLQIKDAPPPSALTLTVNGKPLDVAEAKTEDGWLAVPVPEAALSRGRNKLEATVAQGTGPSTLQDLLLAVRY